MNRTLADYGILCFKQEEFDALLGRFCDVVEVTIAEPRLSYAFRRIRTHADREVIVAIVRTVTQGTADAQKAATDMIEDLHPRCMVVSGIAGAPPCSDVFIGDVVLATSIHDFNLRANQDEGDELAHTAHQMHRKVGVFIAGLAGMTKELGKWNSDEELGCQRPLVHFDRDLVTGTDDWKGKVKHAFETHGMRDRPRFVDGPIASSDDLVRTEDAMRERLKVNRRILATEMESAGVAVACHRAEGDTPLVVIRAISDIVAVSRTEASTAYACNVAASFTRSFLRLDVAETLAHLESASQRTAFVQPTLYELLNYIESRETIAEAMGQCRNALSLFKQLELTGQRLIAERMFGVLDKPVKSLGDKKLVIEVADACIEAVSHGGRSPGEAACEARARICGLSWAYQRMGMLDRAAEEAAESLRLARLIESTVNVAFGKKCSGRLARVRAEAASDDTDTRNQWLSQSHDELLDAVDAFSGLDGFGPDSAEVGDCYSLLGRTSLVMGDVRQADTYAAMATPLLVDESSKDYLDLQILKGELAVRRGDYKGALDRFGVVVRSRTDGDYARSEIVARACMERARLFVDRGQLAKAEEAFEHAASIWDQYGETELAGRAQWELLAARENFPRQIQRIWMEEPSFAVRVAAVQHYVEGSPGVDVVARRRRHDATIARRCLRIARQNKARGLKPK